jgi:hypothetical protein
MKPFTGLDLKRMAYASAGDEDLGRLWDRALIIGLAQGYDEEDLLEMTLQEIFAEEHPMG